MTAFDISSLAEFAVAFEAGVVDEAIRKPNSNEKLIYIIEKRSCIIIIRLWYYYFMLLNLVYILR